MIQNQRDRLAGPISLQVSWAKSCRSSKATSASQQIQAVGSTSLSSEVKSAIGQRRQWWWLSIYAELQASEADYRPCSPELSEEVVRRHRAPPNEAECPSTSPLTLPIAQAVRASWLQCQAIWLNRRYGTEWDSVVAQSGVASRSAWRVLTNCRIQTYALKTI